MQFPGSQTIFVEMLTNLSVFVVCIVKFLFCIAEFSFLVQKRLLFHSDF